MKITIESTATMTEINGVPVRLWEGTTERGAKCKVFVHQIAAHVDEEQAEFENELAETLPPPDLLQSFGGILRDDMAKRGEP